MINNENKKEENGLKKDTLLWNEEDYDAIQKLTGFDEDSIIDEQKKGINIIIFSVCCIAFLIVGIILGYSIHKNETNNNVYFTNNFETKVAIDSVYTRLNESNELYLYVLTNANEEISILNLSNIEYDYELIDESLYVLLKKDNLSLYEYSFDKNGYHRSLVNSFDEKYDLFYFRNNLILLKKDDLIEIYDKTSKLISKMLFAENEILDYNLGYIVFKEGNSLNIYDINSEETKNVTSSLAAFLIFDDNKIYFIDNSKLYTFNVLSGKKEFLTDIKLNSIFVKVNDYYIFNDVISLYILDDSIRKIKDFEYNINEIAYLDQNNIIIILEDYTSNGCLLYEKKFGVFNVSAKSITETNINGCLNTQVINGLIKKQK